MNYKTITLTLQPLEKNWLTMAKEDLLPYQQNLDYRREFKRLDLDLEAPTFSALSSFWNRVVPGGIIIFDEYAIPAWTESNAVDRFFKDKDVQLKTLTWSRTPTAYIIKR